MARRPASARIILGPFGGGMNTAKEPHLLGLDEAASAENVDTSDGTLRGIYGPGSSVVNVGAGKLHIHYQDGLSWASSAFAQSHLYDTIFPASSKRYSLYTDGGVAKYANGTVTGKWLGVAPPTNAPTAGTGSSSARYYRYTYITNRVSTSYAPIESNPTTAARLTTTTVGVVASADAAVDGIRMYASDGDVNGPYYLTDTFANTTGNVTPSATSTSATPLSWEINGRDANATYIDDHAPAPTPNVMSNAMHTAYLPGAEILPGSGILFVGVASFLLWSEVGYPWYFPNTNGWRADGQIEAIITDQATTYVFTRASIFVVTGTNDEDLNFTRSRSPYGTTYGRSAVMTPFGVLFQAEGGLALFDGNTSRLITDGILASSDFTRNFEAVWWDQQLLLVAQSGTAGGYIVDFSRGLDDLRVVKHTINAKAITRADAYATPGPYVADYTTGAVGAFRPKQRGNVTGAAPKAWTWVTGRIDASKVKRATPGTPILPSRIWVEASGTISLSVVAGRYPNTTVGTQVVTGDSWLPGSWGEVDYVEITATSSDGTGVLRSIEIECEVAA